MSAPISHGPSCSFVMEAPSEATDIAPIQSPTIAETPSSQRALKTAEILALILAKTSCVDIQNSRRVCRFWYNAIGDAGSGSKVLGQLRFVRSNPSAENRRIYITQASDNSHKVARLIPPFRTPDMPRHSYEGRPLAQLHPSLVGQSFFASAWDSQIELTFPNLHILFALPAGGEWESTFLTQPPCPQIKIEVAGDAFGVKHDVKIKNANGVTLDQVVSTLKSAITLDLPDSGYGRAAARSVHVTGYVRGWVWSGSDAVKKAERFEESLKQSVTTRTKGKMRRMRSFARAEEWKKAKHGDMVAGAMRRITRRLSSVASAVGRITRRSSSKKST